MEAEAEVEAAAAAVEEAAVRPATEGRRVGLAAVAAAEGAEGAGGWCAGGRMEPRVAVGEPDASPLDRPDAEVEDDIRPHNTTEGGGERGRRTLGHQQQHRHHRPLEVAFQVAVEAE